LPNKRRPQRLRHGRHGEIMAPMIFIINDSVPFAAEIIKIKIKNKNGRHGEIMAPMIFIING
jgi:hypothetical protein